jgi:hypothetical protein
LLVKKIALTIAAVAVLGLAACNKAETDTTNDANVVTEMNATADEAVADINAASADLNAADVAVDNAAAAVDNASDAVAEVNATANAQ